MQSFSASVCEGAFTFCLNHVHLLPSDAPFDPRFPSMCMEIAVSDGDFSGRATVASEEILGLLRAMPAWYRQLQGSLHFSDEGRTELTFSAGKRGNVTIEGVLCGENGAYHFRYRFDAPSLAPLVQQAERFLSDYDARR